MIAAVSRTFADQLTTTSRRSPRSCGDLPRRGPGVVRLVPPARVRRDGLIVVGFSAATFVSKWASDEESGRLELLLTTPLTRVRWALAGGAGAILAVGRHHPRLSRSGSGSVPRSRAARS
jgi:hypothetical protein